MIKIKSLYSCLLVLTTVAFSNCDTNSATDAEWQDKNDQLIKQYKLSTRQIADLPVTGVESNLKAAEVKNLNNLDSIALYPGVDAKIFWGTGNMVAKLQLAPNAQSPEEILPADRFLVVMEGSVNQLVNGEFVEMLAKEREDPDGTHSGTPKMEFIYLEKGSKSALKAGPSGAKLLEVYSPIRADYLKKAGVQNVPASIPDIPVSQQPNIEANKIYNLYDIQFVKLSEGAYSRLISGKNTHLSFVSLDPNTESARHIHPEEQLMMVLRGSGDQIMLDKEEKMEKGDFARIPSNMVHGTKSGELGFDVLDIFWPARPDFLEKEANAGNAFHAIIPKDAKPQLIIDGSKSKPRLTFAEGPKWLNGKVYFSNMFFDQNWNADPKKSSIVEMDPNGNYHNISEGKMQSNGLYPYKNGNLLVCDMIGHRVVEMTTSGKVVRVVVDSYNGKPIDGPNDIVTDSKGGFYFTDPQFTMEAEKYQPGRAVYYVSPEGKITRIVEPNEFAMPNGVVLTPDGKTLYINNCYDDEEWYPVKSEKDNFIWAYDVNPDGTIKNGRKFAKVFLIDKVLDRKGRSTSADGMAIDKMGNLYVATYYGVQIFNGKGEFVGMINLPSFPVSLCFGGADMKTLFIVSYDKVFKIQTNMEGYVNYL